jgi:hypothetical protein
MSRWRSPALGGSTCINATLAYFSYALSYRYRLPSALPISHRRCKLHRVIDNKTTRLSDCVSPSLFQHLVSYCMYAGVTKSTRSLNSGSSLHVGATPLMQAPRILLFLAVHYDIACTSTTVPLQYLPLIDPAPGIWYLFMCKLFDI